MFTGAEINKNQKKLTYAQLLPATPKYTQATQIYEIHIFYRFWQILMGFDTIDSQ